MAQWLSGQLHVSNWKARRMIEAARGLEHLPLTAAALESGALSLDKVVELARFLTPPDEKKLIKWAQRVTTASVRARADYETARALDEVERDRTERTFQWWQSDGGYNVGGFLPTDQGVALIKAVDELAHELPKSPERSEDPTEWTIDQRRADALVLLATGARSDSGAPKATVVLHTQLEELAGDERSPATEGGAALHPETARRLSCDAKLQVVLEGRDRKPLGIGRKSQITPEWLRRQVFHRDGNQCTFPGCESKRFLSPHHIQHWSRQGPTDLDNLITICSFHHTLLHEHRWSVTLTNDGPAWFRPSGRRYVPGPAPPELAAVGGREPPHLAEAAGYSKVFALVNVA